MLEFLFGKKRQVRRKTKAKPSKPSAKMLRICKRLKIKTTKKVGKKRVYKKIGVLKKLIKTKKGSKMRFGSSAGVFNNNSDFGYNQDVIQNLGTTSQSPNYVTSESNLFRPYGISSGGKQVDMRLGKDYIPTYGTGARFFGQTVPRTVSPEWDAMAQPDGSMTQVGAPFYGYTNPSAFGRRHKTARKLVACKGTRKPKCGAINPNCQWRKKRGCVNRRGAATKGSVYQGPSMMFGRRRKTARKLVACKGTRKPKCGAINPNCQWRKKRGCVNRRGAATKGSVYQGPSMMFGKRRKILKVKKLPRSIVKMCRKLKIKTTVKRGSKRVQKKLSVLKKLIAKKKKMLKRRK